MMINVGVAAANSNGQPDVVFFDITCTDAEYQGGEHYDRAKAQATEAGFEPSMAFDERDPAWSVFKSAKPKQVSNLSIAAMAREVWGNPIPAEAYAFSKLLLAELDAPAPDDRVDASFKDFFEYALLRLQTAFIGEDEVSGSDVIDTVGSVFRDFLDADGIKTHTCFMCLTDDGYFNGNTYDFEDQPRVFFDAEKAAQMEKAGWPVAYVPVSSVAHLMPGSEALCDAAEAALERSRKYDFSISEMNAAEVMTEQLVMAGYEIGGLPPEFSPILTFTMLRQIASSREEHSERG